MIKPLFRLRVITTNLKESENLGKLGKMCYRKVPKFLDARKLGCKLPKILTKRPNHKVFRQKDANGIANSEDPDQIASLVAV